MQITVSLDDELYAKAVDAADSNLSNEELISEALKTFVRVQAAKRLAAQGGTAPETHEIARGRSGGL